MMSEADIPNYVAWILNHPIPKSKDHASLEERMSYYQTCRRKEEEGIMRQIKEVCESPIEELVFLELWHEQTQYSDFRFWSQKEIGPYRADFVVELEDRKLVIECDGHDFHEKTKQQAARDKKRDRYMVSQGYTVLRFSGSEIHKNPRQVVDEINNVVYSELVRRDFGY